MSILTTRIYQQPEVGSGIIGDYVLIERLESGIYVSRKLSYENLFIASLGAGGVLVLDNRTGLSGYNPNTTAYTPRIAFLLGLVNKGDFQGGWWNWDNSATGTPDGAGTIAPTSLPISGRWRSSPQ